MKTNIILLATSVLLVSCSNENERNNHVKDNELMEISQDKGIVPTEHPFKLKIQEKILTLNFDELDNIYKSTISVEKDAHYTENLKNEAFFLIMGKGLLDGNIDQKKFYLSEQMKLEQNLPNITNFYKLLNSCRDVMNISESRLMEEKFYRKNIEVIDKMDWRDVNLSIQIRNNLEMRHQEFSQF